MVRISDILKKKMQATPQPTPERPVSISPPSQPQAFTPKASTPESKSLPSEMQVAKAMKEMQPNKAHSHNLYFTGVKLAEDILDKARTRKPIDLNQVKDLIAEIVDSLVLEDKELISLFYDHKHENYLHTHMVNVMIMSVDVGLGLGCNKSKLNELGLAAFLHDIGMIKVEKLAFEPRVLSEEEYNQIKEHPLYGVEILSKIKDIPEAVIYAVKEEHERTNGRGYPQGLKDGNISEYARIIATVDIYEALTHDRTYRKKHAPHEAIKEMLTTSGSFLDTKILRTLISRVGVYPIGSFVELNTDELGKVINTNEDLPLRPVVSVIFDSAARRLEEPRVLNLAKQFNIFIKKPLSDEEVLEKVKEEVG